MIRARSKNAELVFSQELLHCPQLVEEVDWLRAFYIHSPLSLNFLPPFAVQGEWVNRRDSEARSRLSAEAHQPGDKFEPCLHSMAAAHTHKTLIYIYLLQLIGFAITFSPERSELARVCHFTFILSIGSADLQLGWQDIS